MSIHHSPSTVVLFTGLSGSGKSTIAEIIALRLQEKENDRPVLLLDGDTFRQKHAPDLGFSRQDRAVNLFRAGRMAREAADTGSVVLMAFIAPYAEDRLRLRNQIAPHRFVEVWLSTPLEICERRDPKGHYKKARSNQLPSFTGVSEAYEPPSKPDIEVPTHRWPLNRCCEHLLEILKLQTGKKSVTRTLRSGDHLYGAPSTSTPPLVLAV